jgi:hypothetical protein
MLTPEQRTESAKRSSIPLGERSKEQGQDWKKAK